MSKLIQNKWKENSSSNQKKGFSYKLRIFSMQYLAHHPVCKKFDNHVFRIGQLFLCVGCTSVFLAFISYTVVFFSLISFFNLYPYVNGGFAAFGVSMALLQVFIKPKNKWLKAIFRFWLGIGLGAYTAIIVQVSQLDSVLGFYTIFIQIALFLLLIPGVLLYNILRGDSPYMECQECEIKFSEPTCDYNHIIIEKK